MQKRSMLGRLAALLAMAATLLSGCGGEDGSGGTTGTPNALAEVSVSMTDAPPAGVTIFSFEVTLNSAVLQPGSIDLLAGTGPQKIEIKRLETETALINTANVPAGSYTSIQLTFANAHLTFRNDTSPAITLAGCPPGSVCEIDPTGALTATINLPAGGGAIASGTPAAFLVDVNLASLFNADLTLSFDNAQAASLQRITLPTGPTGPVVRMEEVEGIVKDKNTTTNHFTLQTAHGDLDVAVNVATLFDECPANDLSCIENGQAVEVDLGLLAGGVLFARKIEVEDDAADALDDGIEGFIYQIDDATHFRMVTLDFLRGSVGIVRGRRLIVALQSGAVFQVRTGETLPPEIETAKTAFEAATDTSQLQVGQHVQVRFRVLTPEVPPALPTLETDRVRLRETRLTANVASVSGDMFTVDGLPPIFGNLAPAVASIEVFTSADTEFENATGVGDLMTGAQVSLRGPLFLGSPPMMFAEKVRLRTP